MILAVLGFIAGLVCILSLLFAGPRCPDCGGRMRCVGEDLHYSLNVYRCGKCGEEWI